MSSFQQNTQREIDAAAQRQKETEKRKDERISGGEKVKIKENIVLSLFQVLR